MNEITFEKAKEIAINSAKEYGKIITKIEENDEYWKFTAEFEDGVGFKIGEKSGGGYSRWAKAKEIKSD